MKILAGTIFSLTSSLILIGGLMAFLPSPVKAFDASVDGARAVLIQLVELSGKQAIQTKAAQKLLTGEMLTLKLSSFGKLTATPDKVLLVRKNNAVGRFQLFGENSQITDVYFYLRYDNGWKVGAVRLLALTGIIEQAYLGLKAKPNLTEEEKSSAANFKLTLAPDKEMKTWFSENRQMLEKLGALLRAKSGRVFFYVSRDDKQFPEAAALLRKLDLSSASAETDGNVEIVIGGITDNTVGFIYSPSEKPPEINPSLYIWVEKVAVKWYLFRTT